MFRTRDYALLLSAIVFLLVGIATTIFMERGFPFLGGQGAAVFTAAPAAQSHEATVSEKSEQSREDRVASLRKKIAALGTLGGENPVEENPEAEQPSASTVPEAGDEPLKENRCSAYSAGDIAWNSAGVKISEAEGARIVYRENKSVTHSSSSSSTVSTATTKQVLAELPIRTLPSGSQNCIASDVIGITKNGALIRNKELSLYASFGNVLIGYALDGFPIYGAADVKTDVCGGVVVAGQYRYQITNNRDTIIACYAGLPVSL
jgi:hypothetical protein